MKSDDIRILRDIEQYYSTQIDEMPMNGMFHVNTGLNRVGVYINREGAGVTTSRMVHKTTVKAYCFQFSTLHYPTFLRHVRCQSA